MCVTKCTLLLFLYLLMYNCSTISSPYTDFSQLKFILVIFMWNFARPFSLQTVPFFGAACVFFAPFVEDHHRFRHSLSN